jgi:hypothetical protein
VGSVILFPGIFALLGWFNFRADFRPYAPIAILYYSQVSGSYVPGMSIFSAAMLVGAIFEGRAFYSGSNDTLAEMEQREMFQETLGRTSSMYQFALAISAVMGV